MHRLDQVDLIDVSAVGEHEHVPDLLARVLKNAVSDIIRRGFERGYVSRDEELCGVRGRIELSSSSAQLVLRQAKVRCRTDDLSVDIPANRLIRSTIHVLRRADGLNHPLRDDLFSLDRSLREVGLADLNAGAFTRIVFHRNNRQYEFTLAVCKLVMDSLLVDETAGTVRFAGFSRAHGMEMLFQWFVRRFYEKEAGDVVVSAPTAKWLPARGDQSQLALLPEQRTDMLLKWPDRWLIIDTKFTDQILVTDWRSGSERLDASHLFQIYSYVRNFSLRPEAPARVEGMLLYPKVVSELSVEAEIHGYRMRVCTVDLAQPWQDIRQRLLALAA
jgi:5-methylcytosine-specific restriction enzyme subunit McrC